MKTFLIAGALFGFLAVALGAFGAHILKDKLSAYQLEIFEVGVRYQMYHALALLATAWMSQQFPGKASLAAGWLLIAGTSVFSGSLYAIVATGVKAFGAITPVGGLMLLAGWLCLLLSAL